MQDTARKVKELVNKLYRLEHIDLMTHKWLTIGLKQPRIPEFYTLTKIQKKTTVSKEEKQKKKTSVPSVPEYRIVHRGHIDLQNFTHAR